MKPKTVLEQLANQYTLPGGAFYMDEQGTIQTVEDIAELKKYLAIKGATQVIYVKSIDRFVESDSSGVADEVTSWASTHPKRKGYRWVLQTVATASSSVAPYMDFNKEGGGTVRLTFGSEGQPIYTILSCLMLLFSSITGYAQSARTSPIIDRTTHVLAWPSDLWTTNAAAIAAAIPAGSLGTNQLNSQTYGLLTPGADDLAPLKRILEDGTYSFTIPLISDSTGNDFIDWPSKLAGNIGTKYPVYSTWFAAIEQFSTRIGFQQTYVVKTGTAGDQYADLTGGNLTLANSNFPGITGDMQIFSRIRCTDYTAATNQTILAKYGDAGNRSFRFYVNSAKYLVLETSANGTDLIEHVSSSPIIHGDGTDAYVGVKIDVDNGSSGHTVTFYNHTTAGPIALGTNIITSGTTSIYDSTADWSLGALATDTQTLLGRVYYVQAIAGFSSTNACHTVRDLGEWTKVGAVTIQGAPVITIASASLGGADWDYWVQTNVTKAAKLSPNSPVVMFSLGHNEPTNIVGAAHLAKVAAGVGYMKTTFPYAQIIGVGQNRKFSPRPASEIITHARRQLEIATWCKANSVGFVDAGAAVTSDGMNADGVHPIELGAQQWADEFMRLMIGR